MSTTAKVPEILKYLIQLCHYPLVPSNCFWTMSSWYINLGTIDKGKYASKVRILSIGWWNPLVMICSLHVLRCYQCWSMLIYSCLPIPWRLIADEQWCDVSDIHRQCLLHHLLYHTLSQSAHRDYVGTINAPPSIPCCKRCYNRSFSLLSIFQLDCLLVHQLPVLC